MLSQSIIFSQSGWVLQNSGINKHIYSSYFVNDMIGYAGSSGGYILKTINGGNQWFTVYSNPEYDIDDVFFIYSSIGWAIGYRNYPELKNVVLKTINGGATWSEIYIDSLYSYGSEIYFSNPSTGYLACGNIKKTTNSGLNWFTVYENSSSGIFFLNENTGWTSGRNKGVDKTTDGGNSWVIQYPFFYHNYDADIYFVNEQKGFAVNGYFGSYGYLYSTTNYGINWNLNYDFQYMVNSIKFVNNNTGYMLAIGTYNEIALSKTTNCGVNWILHSINTTRVPSHLFFRSVNTGWLVGDSGLIMKTTNGGVTIGILPISTEIPAQFSLSQNYPNPFNPVTKINFSIPLSRGVYEGRGVFTKLFVYDAMGKEISVLVNEQLKPGTYEVDFHGSNYPSGVYFYKLLAGDFTETKKMLILK
jgi:photosystem II stability/assembly factor-like uncharacterized protein